MFISGYANRDEALNNELVFDKDLRIEDKGVALMMIHAEPDWTLEDIVKRCSSGKDAVRSSVKRLVDAGYLKITPRRVNGRVMPSRYEISDRPVFKVG